MIRLHPVTQLEARRFVAKHHRHSRAPLRVICCVGVEDEAGEIVGVGMLERPKAPKLCDGFTVEASRVCTLGARNACSMLYGALCRAAAALGYTRVVSYTLKDEPGSSLLGAGFMRVADIKPESWDRRHIASGSHQPSLFAGAKYGTPLERVRWERRCGVSP